MEKRRTCLWIGLIGALIGTLGEFLGGWAPATDLTSPMTILFSALKAVPAWRLGLCSTIGGLGILLQYFGYYAIGLSFEDRENFRGRLYFAANRGFTIVGAVYHILCCVFLLLLGLTDGNQQILKEFFLWFALPISVLFFISYGTVCILFLLQISSGHSSFPRWCGLLTPLVPALIIQTAVSFLPNSALVNAVSFAGMGLSSILIFSLLLAVDQKNKRI